MLKNRADSMPKDQQMCQITAYGSSAVAQVHKKSSFFSLPGIFVGVNSRVLSDYSEYSADSPTSPLDFRVFSNTIRSPRSPREKIWDCGKVGLSIIDSPDEDHKVSAGKLLESSDVKNNVYGPQLRIRGPNLGTNFPSFESLDEGEKISTRDFVKSSNGKSLLYSPKFDAHVQSSGSPTSLPKNFAFPGTHLKSPLRKGTPGVVFEIGNPVDDDSKFSNTPHLCTLNSPRLKQESPKLDNFSCTMPNSASEMELSEDYTCVTVHGPNPKTTHIYADCVLECKSTHSSYGSPDTSQGLPVVAPTLVNKALETLDLYPSGDFLSLCNMCKKTLAAGKDIYIYRGEKAFCSSVCRARAIHIDKEKEGGDSVGPESNQEFSEADILGS